MTAKKTIAEGEVVLPKDHWAKKIDGGADPVAENPDLVVEGDIFDDDGNLIFPSPGYASLGEQAAANSSKMRMSFQEIIRLVAEAHDKQLWRARRSSDTGEIFGSLVEYCQEQFQVGAVAARRYISAAKNFYIPLSEVTIDGTVLKITSGDVQKLGQDGLHEAVNNIVADLDGDESQEEVDEIITERLSEARAARDKREAVTGDGWDNATTREFYDQPVPDASGPVGTYLDDEDDEALDYVKNPPIRSKVRGEDEFEDNGEFAQQTRNEREVADNPVVAPGSPGHPGAMEDLVAPLLVSASRYDEDSDLDSLPKELRRLVRAAKQIAEFDVSATTALIDFENRGVLLHLREAQDRLLQVRSVCETQPWVLSRLGE